MTLPRQSSTPDSLIALWDGRWKLAGLFVLGLSASIVTNPLVVGIALIVGVILTSLARLSLKSVLLMASVILISVLPLAIAIPFLTTGGLGESTTLVLRALAVGMIGHVAMATAPPHRTFAALAAMRVPRLFVHLLQFSYRYAMLLAGETKRVRVAMAVRGFQIRPTFRTYSTMGNLIGSVLVRGGERAETVNQAMQARGFEGRIRTLDSFRTKYWDVMGFVGMVVIAVGLLFSK